MTLDEAIKSLMALQAKLAAYGHAMGLLFYDGATTAPKGTAANRGQTFPQPCRPPEQRGEQFSPGHIISPYCRERRSWPSRSSRRILRSRRR